MQCTSNLPRRTSSLRFAAVLSLALFVALPAAYSVDSAPTAPGKSSKQSAISTKPFRHFAIGVTGGTLGGGVELVTTMSRKTNLRVDGHFVNYSPSTITQDGVNYGGNIKARDVRASYDYFPFGGAFRLSAGFAAYNQFNVNATALVAAGQSFTLNSVTYYSDPSGVNPLSGNATLGYANKYAPTATLGFGNAIPRSGRHFAFPVELGAAFTGAPKFALNMNPNSVACTTSTYSPTTCGQVATFDNFQPNLAAEQKKITNDIAPFRVYPIMNVGVTYRF
jgi:hypothetical protein